MAIYYLDVKSLSRKDNQSARAHVAYISRAGQYARARPGHDRDRCLHVESVNVPAWGRDGGAEADYRSARRFWSACDSGSRSNARLGVKITVGMPVEMTFHQQLELARTYVTQATTMRDGSVVPATWALHEGKGTNPHLHVCLAETVVDEYPRSAETWFSRAANKGRPPESGGARRTREIHGEWVAEQRAAWQALANLALERAGVDARIDARSHADRGSEDLPQEKVGWGPQAAVRRQRNAQRRSVNDRGRELHAERDRITTTHAAPAATTETPDARPEQRLNDRPGIPGLPGTDRDAGRPVAEPIPGLADSAAGTPQQSAAVPDLADARPAGSQPATDERADAQPRAAAPATRAAAALATSLRGLPSQRVGERRPERAPGLLFGHARDGLDPGRADGNQRLQREGASAACEGDAAWRLTRQRFEVEAQHGWRRPRSKDPLKNASLFWGQLGREMAERIEKFLARLAAVKAAETAAGAGGAAPREKPATLSKTPTLHRLTATSLRLRSLGKLSARDLDEQLQIAQKGVLAMHDQWRQALNARDQKWIASCKAQHAARHGRVESLRAEIARREAAAAHAPAPIAVSAPKPLEEPMNLMTTERLQEQERIALAAMREHAGRRARIEALRIEIANREAATAPGATLVDAAKAVPTATEEPPMNTMTTQHPESQSDLMARQFEMLQKALARQREVAGAARANLALDNQTPEQSSPGDYDTPGRH